MNRWSWFVEEKEEKSPEEVAKKIFRDCQESGSAFPASAELKRHRERASDHLFFAYQHHYFYLPHIQHPLSIRTKTVLSIASAVQHCTSSIASHPTNLRRRLTLPLRRHIRILLPRIRISSVKLRHELHKRSRPYTTSSFYCYGQ